MRWQGLALSTVVLLAPAARADEWDTPKPLKAVSSSGNHLFRVTFPEGPRILGRAEGTLSAPQKDGSEKVLWRVRLVNTPHQVFVADKSQHVVTVDTYANLGHQHTVVLYGDDGKVLADYQLEDLLDRKEIAKHVEMTVSSRWWARRARFAFSPDGKQFVITLDWGRTVPIDLASPPPAASAVRRDNPSLSEILAGMALNAKLEEVQALHRRGAVGPEIPLKAEVLAHLNVARGSGDAASGLLRNAGRLEWPAALKGPDYQAAREQVDRLLPRALEQLRQKKTPADTLQELNRASAKLRGRLKEQLADLPPLPYIEARRYLNEVDRTLKFLGDPDAAECLRAAEQLPTEGKTVGSLVRYLTEKRLRFTAALNKEDDAAYRDLYRALCEYATQAGRTEKK
jgi:hypothetical protein